MNKAKSLIDRSADPNLFNKPFVHLTRTPRVKRRDFQKLRSANKQPIRSEEAILLYLQIGDLRIRPWFGVVENTAVDFY